MDDSLLIKACKKQDRDAQQELYEKYAKKMMAICLRYSNDRETASDLLHDGFIQVFTHIRSLEGTGSFEGWMRRIFVNLALANYRKEQKEGGTKVDLDQIESEPAENDEEDDYFALYKITREELIDLISALPTGYRTIFNLFVFEDKPHKEIAKMLGISEASSRSQYSRAKALLKKKIKAIVEKRK